MWGLILIWIMCSVVAAAPKIAVMEIVGELAEGERMLISDSLRGGVSEVALTEDLLVMTRENLLVVLTDQGLDSSCMEGDCEVQVARNLGADFVLSGNCIDVEGQHVLTVKLHEVHRGALLLSDHVQANTVLELTEKARSLGTDLIHRGLKLNEISVQPSPTVSGSVEKPIVDSPSHEMVHVQTALGSVFVHPPIRYTNGGYHDAKDTKVSERQVRAILMLTPEGEEIERNFEPQLRSIDHCVNLWSRQLNWKKQPANIIAGVLVPYYGIPLLVKGSVENMRAKEFSALAKGKHDSRYLLLREVNRILGVDFDEPVHDDFNPYLMNARNSRGHCQQLWDAYAH